MITDGTLPAAIKTYETLTENKRQPVQQPVQQTQQQQLMAPAGILTEQQRAAINAQAVFGDDPMMSALFADTLANASNDELEARIRMEAIQSRQANSMAPVPEMGAAFPRNMLPPRDPNAPELLSEGMSNGMGSDSMSAKWAKLAYNKSSTPRPNQPGFLPGKR